MQDFFVFHDCSSIVAVLPISDAYHNHSVTEHEKLIDSLSHVMHGTFHNLPKFVVSSLEITMQTLELPPVICAGGDNLPDPPKPK